MTQRYKKDFFAPKVPSTPQFKDIQKSLQQSFSILVLECGSFCREMKEILSGKLKITLNQTLHLESIQSPSVKQFKQATLLMNQDLKSILSLTKILVSGKVALTGLDSNQYRILKSCVSLNELAVLLDQFFSSTEISLQYKPNLLSLMKSLSDNIYGYQSSNTEFNELIQEFATRSPSINLQIPTSMKSSRSTDKYASTSSNQIDNKQIENLKRILAQKQIQFEKNNEQFSICIEEYNNYIYELKDEIANLNDQLLLIQKDRQQLKQHNLILLKSTGVLPQKISNSRMSMRNTKRRLTLTQFDDRSSLRRSEAPHSYRTSNHPNETSFMSMTRLFTIDKK